MRIENDLKFLQKKENGKWVVSIKCNFCFVRKEVQFQSSHKTKLYSCRSCSSSGKNNGMYKNGKLISGVNNGNFGGLAANHKKNISISKTGKKLDLTEIQRQKRAIVGTNNLKIWKEKNPEESKLASIKGGVNSLKLQSDFGRISSIEQKTIDWLKIKNVDFIFQFSINNKFLYDFKIKNFLIEVNGIWFHNLPNQKIRDLEKRKYAEINGYIVIYIWEDEINKNDFSKLEDLL